LTPERISDTDRYLKKSGGRPIDESGTAAFDPFEPPGTIEPGAVDDPYSYLATARRKGSVQTEWPLPLDERPPDEPSFCVLGYDEVLAALRDHETYSSRILSEMMGPMFAGTIIAMDEPEHRAHRALVAPAFRPKLLARWEQGLVRRVVDELIDSWASLDRADIVRRLTFAFPVRVIARILGLPDADTQRFQRWSIDLISIFLNWDRGIRALHELRSYFGEQVAARRAEPRDDLISELVTTEIDGERLDDEAVFAFLRVLLPAGVETTYRSLGNLLLALLTHPHQLEEVTHRPELRGAAIEEGLRWEAPFLMVARRATCGAHLGGVDIPAGRELSIFIGSANRDEQRYPHPDRFDIHRQQVPHLSFGSGPHMCLGMHLSRMETRVALDAVLERLRNLRLDGDAPRPRIVGNVFRSPDALPVRFDHV
jgi:cytochrome P450